MVIKALMKLFGAGSDKTEEKVAAPGRESSGNAGGRPVSVKDLEGFVAYVVKALVDSPEEVEVTTKEEGDDKVIWITCKKEDTGKIIGKKGKTIIALRALVAGAAGRMQNRVKVEVAD